MSIAQMRETLIHSANMNQCLLCPRPFSKYRFPPLCESSVPLKSFVSWKWGKVEHQLPLIYMETFLNIPRLKKNIYLRLFCYLRTHLANGCTKWIKIKHRCAETQFKATVAGCCGILSLVLGEGAWWGHSHCLGHAVSKMGCSKTNAECHFSILPFFFPL